MATEAVLRKCRCKSVWCPSCWSSAVKSHASELREFDWRRTREVVLTVDPSRYESGREAYEHVSGHKLIAGLVRNLTRGMKAKDPGSGLWNLVFPALKISRWKWFLEWHEGGFPHWHLFIEVEKAGAAGMIGGERLRHYWGAGSWVYESYIKNAGHWEKVTGYFGKNGYFDPAGHKKGTGKAHQGRLPSWAAEGFGTGRKIRRSCASANPSEKVEERSIPVERSMFAQWCRWQKDAARWVSYRVIIHRCGMRSRIRIWSEGTYASVLVAVPYSDIRARVKGEYREGVGYAFKLSRADFDFILNPTLILRVEEYRSGKNGRDQFAARAERIFDAWVERGFSRARKHYGWGAEDEIKEAA